jgi:hypothetical protein
MPEKALVRSVIVSPPPVPESKPLLSPVAMEVTAPSTPPLPPGLVTELTAVFNILFPTNPAIPRRTLALAFFSLTGFCD